MFKLGQLVYHIGLQGEIVEFTYGEIPYIDYIHEKTRNIFATIKDAKQSERYQMLQLLYNSDVSEEIINEIADSIKDVDCCYDCLFARERDSDKFYCGLQGKERSYVDPGYVCNKYIKE